MPHDPFESPSRNQPCWCGSSRKYKLCHGTGPRWPAGAPLPEEEPKDGIWISPDTTLSQKALDGLVAQMSGAPIWAPSDEPKQRPLVVEEFSARLASVPLLRPTVSLKAIAAERNDGLDALGLGSDDSDRVLRRLRDCSGGDRERLADAVFGAGKRTLDRLREQSMEAEPPVALWAGGADPARIAGQTLLWADHYLVDDAVAAALLTGDDEQLAQSLAAELRLRPLLEAGVVVLVPEQLAQVLAAQPAYAATEEDLGRADFLKLVLSQLWLEGPTAREALLVHARDGDDLGQVFFYGRIEATGDDGTFTTSSLVDRYDPAHDYRPWMEQVRRQSAAQLVQELNLNVAIAQHLGGQRLALTPFEARLLRGKGQGAGTPSPLLWTDVPSLPSADAATIAHIAAEDATVAALRQTVRRGLVSASGNGGRHGAAEIAQQLREDAEALRTSMQRDRLWQVGAPGGLGVAGLVLGAVTGGPLGAAAAALSAVAGLTPAIADRRAQKSQAAYAVLLADRRARAR